MFIQNLSKQIQIDKLSLIFQFENCGYANLGGVLLGTKIDIKRNVAYCCTHTYVLKVAPNFLTTCRIQKQIFNWALGTIFQFWNKEIVAYGQITWISASRCQNNKTNDFEGTKQFIFTIIQ